MFTNIHLKPYGANAGRDMCGFGTSFINLKAGADE